MTDPWEKAYVYGRHYGGKVAHIVVQTRWVDDTLCGEVVHRFNRFAAPYPVCARCRSTVGAKELGL